MDVTSFLWRFSITKQAPPTLTRHHELHLMQLWEISGEIYHYKIISGKALELVGSYQHPNPVCRRIPLACLVSIDNGEMTAATTPTKPMILQACHDPSPDRWTMKTVEGTVPYRTTASLVLWQVDISAKAEAGAPARSLPMAKARAGAPAGSLAISSSPSPASRTTTIETKTTETSTLSGSGVRECTCSTTLLYGNDGDVELCGYVGEVLGCVFGKTVCMAVPGYKA